MHQDLKVSENLKIFFSPSTDLYKICLYLNTDKKKYIEKESQHLHLI